MSALVISGCTMRSTTAVDLPWSRVISVVDGDTLVVRVDGHRETVRLIGIDTPETKHPTKPVGCFGPEASAHTAALLVPGSLIRLERDREARDRYGRLLVYAFTSEGLFINLHLVQAGFATTLPIEPNTAHQLAFADAARDAQAARRGLWGKCTTMSG